MTIEAKEILCSENPQGSRLMTQKWIAPKFIHQESLRHRMIYLMDFLRAEFEADFSFSVSSSRAIPFERLAAEASDPALMAKPVHWGMAQKGMSPTDEEIDDIDKCIFWATVLRDLKLTYTVADRQFITKRQCVERLWELGGQLDVSIARAMVELTDVHKSIANRQIESHVHVHCLASATTNGWLNFFGLRLDKAADPTLRALAEASWRVWNESKPQKLEPGQWHLPFVNIDEEIDRNGWSPDHIEGGDGETWDDVLDFCLKASVARCARLSYLSFNTGKRSTIEEDLTLYGRLVGSSPIHASPAEHQATPDTPRKWPADILRWEEDLARDLPQWNNLHEAKNLGPGWRQYRAMLPGEAVAPLPEEYR